MVSDQSPIIVKLVEYDQKLDIKIKKTFKGSLLKVIREVQEQAERLNPISTEINTKTWQREETPSFPREALRESILNAFCSADYFIRSNIKIEFFINEAKIITPGGVYKTTLDAVLSGKQTYRNERLVHLMDKLGMIKNYGTGIMKSVEAYVGTEAKPNFFNDEFAFIVYLPNLNYKSAIEEPFGERAAEEGKEEQREEKIIEAKISDLGLRILGELSKKPGMKVQEIYECISKDVEDVTEDKIRNSIRRELSNLIVHVGSNKTGGYFIRQ